MIDDRIRQQPQPRQVSLGRGAAMGWSCPFAGSGEKPWESGSPEACSIMVERKTVRNVLEEVLKAADEDVIPGIEALGSLIHRQLPCDEGMQLDDGGNFVIIDDDDCQVERPAPTALAHATHALSLETLEGLSLARERLGALLATKVGQHVTRSEIVDQALRIVLEDFEIKGMDSTLVRKILTVTRNKA